MSNTVNIIVIGYNNPDLDTLCLTSVQKSTKCSYLLTYFDNYDSGFTLTAIWNVLIKSSPFEFVCLLNNDTQVYPNWLERMMETMTLGPKDVGFVGPSTNQCHSPQKEIGSYEKAQTYIGKTVKMKQPISGFCLLFRKSLWKHLNGFDENYTLYGQESDFIDRAQRIGYNCYWRQDSFVYHVGEASVLASGIDAQKERDKAKKVYWSTRVKQ